jgi:hypothetical protein
MTVMLDLASRESLCTLGVQDMLLGIARQERADEH